MRRSRRYTGRDGGDWTAGMVICMIVSLTLGSISVYSCIENTKKQYDTEWPDPADITWHVEATQLFENTRASFTLTAEDTRARLDRYNASVLESWAEMHPEAEELEPTPEPIPEPEPEPASRYPAITEDEREMIACLVWQESRGESFDGQQAVAEVVLNRVLSPGFPDTVEKVIYQNNPCVQFTPAYLIAQTTPTGTQYDAVDSALSGPWVLDADYLYFSTGAVTQRDIKQIGAHYFSK